MKTNRFWLVTTFILLASLIGCSTTSRPVLERVAPTRPKLSGNYKVSVAVDGKPVETFREKRVHYMQLSPNDLRALGRHLPKRVNVPFGSVPEISAAGEMVGFRVVAKPGASRAMTMGLQEGDVVTAVNTAHVTSILDLKKLITALNNDKRASMTFLRNGEHHKILFSLVTS